MRYFIPALFLLLPVLSLNNAPSLFIQPTKLAFHLKPPVSPDIFNTQHTKQSPATDTTSLKQSNWYAEAMKGIEESEYEIKYDEASKSYASPNRKNNLRVFYTGDQFTLSPRNDSADKWKLDLTLQGVYSGKQKIYSPTANAVVTQSGKTIQFNHNNNFTVEYINNKEGVRQNFIIQKEPAGKPQTINIKLSAGSGGQTNDGWFVNKVTNKEIHFAKATKTGYDKKITYNGLKVWDANNKELEASFAVDNDNISIEVNTENAIYPVTIDPLSSGTTSTPDWIGDDGDQPNIFFGTSMASAGDVNGDGYSDVIVGAYGFDDGANVDEGRAFLYYGSATGLSATPGSTPDDADQPSAYFGVCVASAGDVNGDGFSDVIIGASGYNNNFVDDGVAYVYYGSAGGLSASPNTALAGANKANAYFGISVACAGDVNGDGFSDVIVGAYGYDDGPNATEGRAFVYHGSAAGLSATPNSTPDDADQADARFGVCVACAGDVNGDGYSDVIIGAHYYTDGANVQEGRAFVYFGGPTGISASPDNTPDDADQLNAHFGRSVASAGDVNGDGYGDVIIGAFEASDGGNQGEGKAFVYYGNPVTGLSLTPDSTPDDADQVAANFGWSVACAGDVNGDGYSDVIIGAPYYNGANTDEGGVFVYLGSSTGLSASPYSTPNDANQDNAYFGWCVASAGDVNGDGYSDVIIGSPYYNDGANVDEGRTFVYHGSPDGLSTTSNWATESNQTSANYGISVASAGDVNSDGYSDVIVGAYIYDQVFGDDGKAYLYLGSATGLSTTAAWTASGSMANEYFGRCVAGAGDVNGDGYGDVLVGAYGYTSNQSQEGRAYLFYGSAGGLAASAAWTYENNVAGSVLGVSVASAGDVNGDGYTDIILGAPQYSNPQANEGKVYLFYGSSTIPAATANWSVESDQVGGWFGVSVASLGDVNGDGYSDIIFGAQLYDGGFTDEGGAFAYYGSSAGLPTTPNWTAKGNQINAQYGISVASAGDVNGDGYSDAIVGATFYDNGTTDEGAAFVYYGSTTGLSASANWTGDNNIANSYFGYSASSAGDVNGDGYSDVLIGARAVNNGQVDEGALYAYYGSSTGLSATVNWYVESNVANTYLGNSVACAGDVNGDGYSDVIGGAPYYPNPDFREGGAFVYYGNKGTGIRNNLRLYNIDLVTPIQWSNFLEPLQFGAGLFAKSPLGRVKGKLVWQVKKQGLPFSGNPITNSTLFSGKQVPFTNLGIAGTELKNIVIKADFQNKVRVRVEYDKTTAITGQVYGPWRYPPGYLQGAHGLNSLPLPVVLLSFTAQAKNDNDVQLNWIVTSETDLKNYIVERSTDGINFAAVGIVAAKGINGLRTEYNFVDTKGFNNARVVYYRLQLTENSGTTSYTKTVTLNKKNQLSSYVYPNPVTKGTGVVLFIQSTLNNLPIDIIVIDAAGKKQLQQNAIIHTGKNEININSAKLSAGIYFVIVNTAGEQTQYKLVVQ